MGEMEREIKRLRHHVSVLSKRNHQLVKDGKSRAVPPIASGTSLSAKKSEEVAKVDEEAAVEKEGSVAVVAESVASFEEPEVAEPVVRLPVAVKGEGGKRRRVDDSGIEEEKDRKREEELIAPLGPRALCGGLLRKVGKESVFAEADPRLVAGGGPKPAAVGVSRRLEAWRQSPGASGGCQLRPGFGYKGMDCGGRGRGGGVWFYFYCFVLFLGVGFRYRFTEEEEASGSTHTGEVCILSR